MRFLRKPYLCSVMLFYSRTLQSLHFTMGRLQKKNRRKLKSVDPYNKKGNLLKEKERAHKNSAPKEAEVDEQLMPRALIELGESVQKMETEKTFPKKKKIKNRIIEEALKHGYERQRFESDASLVRRVTNSTYDTIETLELKAKSGLAGRDQKEIDKDYEEIKAKEERHKQNEKRRKEKIKAEKQPVKRVEEEEEEEGEEDDYDDEEMSDEEEEGGKVEVKKVVQTLPKKQAKKLAKAEKKEDLKQRKRQLREEEKEAEMKERKLNRTEYIAFGERYDGPPKFNLDAKFTQKMTQLKAKAGQKSLLLKDLLEKKDEKKTEYKESAEKKTKLQEADRQKVIDAYRSLKRKRRLEAAETEAEPV